MAEIPPEFQVRIDNVIQRFCDENPEVEIEDAIELITDAIFIYEEFIRDRLIKAGLA